MRPKLIFVYNADSDLFSTVTDFAHKILSPDTYLCKLCSITHNNFGIKKQWEQFIRTLKADVKFLHKDEFLEKHSGLNGSCFPAVFYEKDSNVKLFITDKDINECNSLDELKKLITTNLIQ